MATEAFILKGGSPLFISLRPLKSLFMVVYALVVKILLLPFKERRRLSQVDQKPGSGSGSGGGKDHEESPRKGALVRVPSKMVVRKSGGGGLAAVVMKAVDQAVALRRELAIRRVTEDDDQTCVRDYWLFRTKRGDVMFTQSWTPASDNIRGIILIMHGLNEHSGRYSHFAKQLNASGYKVYGMDWVGHGGSDGLHAYVHSLDDAVSDMKVFLEKILTDHPGLPCFCFGHSTGGAIILKAMLDPKYEDCIAGIVLSAPAVGVEASHPMLVAVAPVVSYLLPRYECRTAYKKGLPVCRDPEAVTAKYSDPLVCTGPLRVRTGYEILRITNFLQQNFRKIAVPFFVLHGTADNVTDPVASQQFYEEASSFDKSIKLLEGYLHDLLFEPERDYIMQDIIEWLNKRI